MALVPCRFESGRGYHHAFAKQKRLAENDRKWQWFCKNLVNLHCHNRKTQIP